MHTTSDRAVNITSAPHEHCTVLIFKESPDAQLLRRVRGEYHEMPGMRLTVEQAMRLWMVDRKTCAHVLESLVASHFLRQDASGRYAMAHAGY